MEDSLRLALLEKDYAAALSDIERFREESLRFQRMLIDERQKHKALLCEILEAWTPYSAVIALGFDFGVGANECLERRSNFFNIMNKIRDMLS